ncbi:MAG: penicillin-binding protein 2, penicillin-binding protein 2 [Candidatus Taylorbacteria bacterium]|nr:penicillin-binding protein 2, penicillin-binding protein 2 [Candidatus Taylorbacteria bacterium]
MTRKLRKLFQRRSSLHEIDPDEIFLDSHNIPQFDTDQFEGRIDRPISRMSLIMTLLAFALILCVYLSRVWDLQVVKGADFNQKSENNRLRHSPIFAARGVIYDRNNVELGWNAPGDDADVSLRKYKNIPGLAHVLGYVRYPSKDSSGFYYREDFEGVDGVEKYFNDKLRGTNGLKLIEVDAHGKVQSENGIQAPKEGENIALSIDSRVQSELHAAIKHIAESVGFNGGGGIIMDVHTGEVIAMTSYPEFDPQIMSDRADKTLITKYLTDKNTPFLDRVIDGLYTPGSIVKPYVALGALKENIIDPNTNILGTAYISIKNQYDPTQETLFRDWKAQGLVDMRKAIAVSSDVYFYEIGGGYKDQKGLGIAKLDHYFQLFGFGEQIKDSFFTGGSGFIPTPELKAKQFNGESWRLGDTYHTAIGQYSFQVTPIQMVRAVASIANNGALLNPTILKDQQGSVERQLDIPASDFEVIREGMRKGALEGTGVSLNVPYVHMATKSGTAELGVTKENVNSWMTGFFPYENPRYAFAVVLERGSRHNLIGAGAAMRETIDWMSKNTPEYFK